MTGKKGPNISIGEQKCCQLLLTTTVTGNQRKSRFDFEGLQANILNIT